MKILHAAETIKGGVATVMKQISASQLNHKGIERLICIIPDSQRNELDCIPDENIVTFKRKRRNIRAFLHFFFVFICQVWNEKPDVVHLHSTFSGVFGRIALILLSPLRRTKVIYCPHAFSFLMESSKLKKKIYIIIEKILLNATDKVICVSNYEYQEAVKSGLNSNKLVTIHNGVPAKIYKKKLARNEKIKLLFVGRFDYQKGYDLLIKAFQQCCKQSFHLTIVGDRVNENTDRVNLDNVTYTGWLASRDIEEYFMDADALVIPSRWEGFAMVPLEAMSYSLPVISSNATSLPEVVKDGKTGFLFRNGDADALVSILAKLHQFDLAELGKNGNEFFISEFTSDKMIEKTNSLYRALQ